MLSPQSRVPDFRERSFGLSVDGMLMPIVIVFVLFGLLLAFSQSSAVAPFIYTLF